MIDPRLLLDFMDSIHRLPVDQQLRAVHLYAEALVPAEVAERERPRDFGQQWDKAGPNDLANKVSGRDAA